MINTMKVVYPNICTWEKDYIQHDILRNEYEFVTFDLTIDSINAVCSNTELINNCIYVTSAHLRQPYIVSMINSLNPKLVIYLSDESGASFDLCNCIKAHNCGLIYCYHYPVYDQLNPSKTIQMPLGYVSGFLEHCNKLSKNLTNKRIVDRDYNCSFVGVIKQDRQEMVHTFEKNVDKCCFNPLLNEHMFQLGNLNVSPADLYKLYNNSVFVVNGRGYISLDCFRIYEAIVAGAIPVIVGSKKEIDETFYYDGYSFKYVSATTWQEASVKCIELLKNKDELQSMQDYNSLWWQRKLDTMYRLVCDYRL